MEHNIKFWLGLGNITLCHYLVTYVSEVVPNQVVMCGSIT